MKAYIYRCSRKEDMYIYLAARDDFSCVPADVMRALGITEFTMELDLTPEIKLAKEDVATVMNNLDDRGFHLQLPGDTSVEALISRIARG